MNQVPVHSQFLSRVNRLLTAAVIITAFAHFLVVNALSIKGFVFKDLKLKANDLVSEHQQMESAVSTLASYQSLNPRIQSMRLVSADSVTYLSWDQGMVARK